MTDDRDYIVGASVVLTVELLAPNTQSPMTATSVTLDALYVGTTPVTVSSPAFTLVTTGVWTYTVDTTDYAPGVYTWRARAVTPDGVGVNEDQFILRAPFGPAP